METLLIIDDDEDIVETVRMVLSRHGWEVESASDCTGGLDRLRAGLRPKVVLLDLLMPGLDGWHVCEVMRGDPALRDIPVVVVSGAGDVAERAREFGARGYLRKPFELAELIEAVDRAVTSEGPESRSRTTPAS